MKSIHSQQPERIRSKGQVTLRLHDSVEIAATIRDVGVTAIGVIAPIGLGPGSHVRIESHAYAAEGAVARCEPEGSLYYMSIDLAPVLPAQTTGS